MKIGLTVYNVAAAELVELAVAADELGFESLWLGEHVVLPVGYGSEHPTAGGTGHQHHTGAIVDPATTLIDPLVALAAAAAVTRRIRLATGIFLLPLRHPLVTARMTATLHDVAGGRFVLGVGSGWLQEEFAALGVGFDDRGSRFDESIDVVRAAWSGKVFSHDGRHYRFADVQVTPAPVHIPLILGGNTDRALRRAALKADGWFSSGTPALTDVVGYRDRLLELRQAHGRAGEFEMYVRIAAADSDAVARYASAGFDHVLVWADQVWPAEGSAAAKRGALAAAAARLGLAS